MADPKLRSFAVNVSDSVLKDLRERLKRTRFPEEAHPSGWAYGVNIGFMKQLVDYWLRDYKWRKHEEYLNSFAQFTGKIDEIKIHFIHERCANSRAPALLLTHGWPDSFLRFHKVIPLLSSRFNVVAPSLPGFGFSDPIAMASPAIAELFAKLMRNVLGYERFFAAGGDIGSAVTRQLALKFADSVTGIHLTEVGYPTGKEDPASLSAAEKEFVEVCQRWLMTEGSYAMINSTKPNSIALSLNDSPAGLAGWIVSFINTGADKNNIGKAFGSRDDLLTNIMIYWITQTSRSAAASYAEEAKAARVQAEKSVARSHVPAAIALFPRTAQFPKEWAERFVTVKRFRKMPTGGHFAALETPVLYANDIVDAFKEMSPESFRDYTDSTTRPRERASGNPPPL